MKNILNFDFIEKLNCSKDILFCLEQSVNLWTGEKESSTITSLKLCLSLIINSRFVISLLSLGENEIITLKEKYEKLAQQKEYQLSQEIIDVFQTLYKFKYSFNAISLFYLILSNDADLVNRLGKILNKENLLDYIQEMIFASDNNLNTIIPFELQPVLYFPGYLNTYNIIPRGKETESINNVLNDYHSNKSIIVAGKPGIGKTTFLKDIIVKNIKRRFFILNICSLVELKDIHLVYDLFNFIETSRRTILCIENLETLFSDPSNLKEVFVVFKDLLISKLNSNKIRIIASLDCKYIDFFKSVQNLFIYNLNEPKRGLVKSILQAHVQRLKTLHNKHHMELKDSMLSSLLNLTDKYFPSSFSFPEKGILVLESLYKNTKKITKKSIIECISNHVHLPKVVVSTFDSKFDVNKIEKDLKQKVYGQDRVVDQIFSCLKSSLIGIKDTTRPVGSFLLCGPSGTGKTELVKSLADIFAADSSILRFDMSEFMEKHSISKLIGCPPGYVGYDSGGLLTEAIKNKPYSIVLFDEIEKAHKDINNIMLQMLDEGRLTDSKGNIVDCTNTIVLYTSNLGCPKKADIFKSLKGGEEMSDEDYKTLCSRVDKATKKFFRPELLNRLDAILVFKPLSIQNLIPIVNKFLESLEKRIVKSRINLKMTVEEEVKYIIAEMAYNPLYGARPLRRVIGRTVEKPITDYFIKYKTNGPCSVDFEAIKIEEKKKIQVTFKSKNITEVIILPAADIV